MKKSEVKKQIEKLREEINQHNYKYYVENKPVISDFEFDKLLKKLEELEKRYNKRFNDIYSAINYLLKKDNDIIEHLVILTLEFHLQYIKAQ